MIDSPCIEWTGARNDRGYGQRRIQNKIKYVHRLTWEQAHGQIPEGMVVCHVCDNPPCHNIDHLFLGTPSDNVRDMLSKGRSRNGMLPGEEHRNAKLTDEEVADIRRLYAAGHRIVTLSHEFGVGVAHISHIVYGRRRTKPTGYWAKQA